MKPKLATWTSRLAALAIALPLAAASPARQAAPQGDEETDGGRQTEVQTPEDKPAPRTAEDALAIVAAGAGEPAPRLDPPEIEPPDGEWLLDDEGRQYFWRRLPKAETWYWTSPAKTHVRYRAFEYYEVAREDDDAFYVKVFRPVDMEPYDLSGLSAEERSRIPETYVVKTGEADRVRLTPFGDGLPESGQWRNGFDVADMNGDGHLDIVHAPPRKLSFYPVIFLGDGAGSWRVWREVSYPPIGYSYGDAKVADFNGDGHNDIALGMHVNGLAVLLGDGEGGFRSSGEGLDHWRPDSNKQPGFSSRAIHLTDWNRDGRMDIVALGEGPRPQLGSPSGAPSIEGSAFGFAVYLNQADGSWAKLRQPVEAQLFGDSVAVGDFNGDGHPDVATGSHTNGLRQIVHYGTADGGWRTVEVGEARRRSLINAVAVADFDGDGRDDLALSYVGNEDGQWRSGIDLLYSRERETWERLPLYVVEDRAPLHALAAGDVDGDGRVDLAALDDNGETLLFSRTAGGWVRETSPEVVPVEEGCRGYHAMLVDLDGDGRDELVTGFAGEPSALFAPDQCRSQGALRAWKAARAAAD